jgi:lycopene cyclase domain-containing protein
MMDSLHYLLILGACLVATAPLELILGARVYRQPRRLLATLLPVVVVFGLWDRFGVARGDWWFAERYTVGLQVLGLPVEEWLFFAVIPVCAVLTFEAMGIRARQPQAPAMTAGHHVG